MMSAPSKKWYEKMPHPFILLFLMIVLASIATYIVPAGEYTREGRRVIADSYHLVAQTPVSFMDFLMAIPDGIIKAGYVVVITLVAGAMFSVLQSTGAIENGVGCAVKAIGLHRYKTLIWVVVGLFVFLGATVGFENNIAVTPIAVFVAIALGGDAMVGAGIAVAGIGMGFATSPINPYTVVIAHNIAGLPAYNGIAYRTLYCFLTFLVTGFHVIKYMDRIKKDPSASLVADVDMSDMSLSRPIEEYSLSTRNILVLATLVGGIGFVIASSLLWNWYLPQFCGIFMFVAIVGSLLGGISPNEMVNRMVKGASSVVGGALAIGIAVGIQVILTKGHLNDAIVHALVAPLKGFSVQVSSVLMSLAHCAINFLIPSGSGQAMATMPIMVPLSELVGMTKEAAVMAFQIGDGVTNLIYPTNGGMLAMLALTRVSFDRWFRFVFPLVAKVVLLGWVMMCVAIQFSSVIPGWAM